MNTSGRYEVTTSFTFVLIRFVQVGAWSKNRGQDRIFDSLVVYPASAGVCE